MLSGDDTEELGPSLPFAPQVHVERVPTYRTCYLQRVLCKASE